MEALTPLIPGNGSNSEGGETYYSLLCNYAHQGAYFSPCEARKKREPAAFLDKMEDCARSANVFCIWVNNRKVFGRLILIYAHSNFAHFET